MNMSASESATPRLYAEALAASRDGMPAASANLFRRVLVCLEIAADFFTCAVGMIAAYSIDLAMTQERHIHYSMRQVAAASIAMGLLSVMFLGRNSAYRGGGSLLQIRETERALRIPVQSLLVLLPFILLFDLSPSYLAIVLAFMLIPVLLILQKLTLFSIVRLLQVMGYGTERTVIYGVGDSGRRIVSVLFHSVRLGLVPVAVIDDNPALSEKPIVEMAYRRRRSVPVQRGPLTPELLQSYRCSMLIVALPHLSPERQTAAIDAAKQAGLRIAFLSGLELQEQHWTQSIDVDGLTLTPGADRFASWPYTIAKRTIDLILSSLLLVLLAPLLLMIALLVRLDSPGPALFIQRRVGRNGELFNIYKFRSMHTSARKYDFSPTDSNDPRVTRIGRFLRRASLDELPQFANVLIGNMSLVGPRPEMPFIVQNYSSEHRLRLQVTPGITGLWQLSADRAFLIHENIQYDLYYIRNRGFFMDIAILIHTLFFAIRHDGSSRGIS
jgi:exopolysaccharide biosynthesis polyprenyl glycosylphosphotransferase